MNKIKDNNDCNGYQVCMKWKLSSSNIENNKKKNDKFEIKYILDDDNDEKKEEIEHLEWKIAKYSTIKPNDKNNEFVTNILDSFIYDKIINFVFWVIFRIQFQ